MMILIRRTMYRKFADVFDTADIDFDMHVKQEFRRGHTTHDQFSLLKPLMFAMKSLILLSQKNRILHYFVVMS